MKAVLLGEKGLLDDDTKELYQGAGIIHIFSISGLHITLIGTGVLTLLGLLRIPLPVRAAAALAVIYLYGKMIGMGTSVFRAIVMFSLYIIAKAIGRTYDLLTAAGIACLLLLLDQPLYFLHTGFLFTFAAVLSIGILIPALPGKALKILAVPLGTLPVCLWMNGNPPRLPVDERDFPAFFTAAESGCHTADDGSDGKCRSGSPDRDSRQRRSIGLGGFFFILLRGIDDSPDRRQYSGTLQGSFFFLLPCGIDDSPDRGQLRGACTGSRCFLRLRDTAHRPDRRSAGRADPGSVSCPGGSVRKAPGARDRPGKAIGCPDHPLLCNALCPVGMF